MGFTTILLVLLMNGQSFGVQLSDSDKVESYIRDLIKRFEETPTDMMFSSVIHPPLIKDPSSKAAFFLPKVLLWSPQEHFVVPMKCPIHKKPLHPSMWTINVSGRKDYSEARLIYDIQGNVILVQRIYRCTEGKYGHKMRSTSLDVLCSLPSDIQAFCPIALFQRSGCTKRLLQYIETQIFQGENFLKISEGLAHLNFQEFCRMRNIYMTTAKEINENSTSARVDDFYKNVLFSFPSNDQIMNLYLNLFNKNKHLYEKDMENLKAAALSCDHTFKISRNIGLVRESDNKFITQFKQLFIVMNEKGEVVAWRLTTSTGFSEIQDLLYRLKLRLDKGDSKIEVICVDDCCRVRNKYHQIFPEAEVKLDLFHACQRVIRTMPITNSLYNDAVKSFIQIFRQDDDQGETRLKSTPEKDVIERNLNSFMQRWINVPSSPITSSTLTEIENLRSHISKGCLSDIPPGYGTEKNEYLHRLLNRSLITGATTISVEVAIALLTVFFYYHNKKITSLPHSCNKRIRPPVPIEAIRCPGEKPDCTGAQETDCSHLKATENKEKSTFQSSVGKRGIISDGEPFMVMADHIDDICNETVAGSILNAATKLQEMIENIDKKNNDRSFNALDLIYLSSFTDALALDGDTVVEDPTINSHLQILERQLAGFGLCVDEVQKDGDCAFRSVIRQFRKRARDDEIIANHDKLMQLPPDEDEATFALRQLFVDEITKESCETSQFLCGTSQEISRKASEFRIKGVFDREIGDVVMKTCANIIKIPIMVITSNQSIPYIPFLPDDALSSEPIYVAYHFYGAGHYDATDSMTYGKLYVASLKGTIHLVTGMEIFHEFNNLVIVCLPFTWAIRSDHGLDKW